MSPMSRRVTQGYTPFICHLAILDKQNPPNWMKNKGPESSWAHLYLEMVVYSYKPLTKEAPPGCVADQN